MRALLSVAGVPQISAGRLCLFGASTADPELCDLSIARSDRAVSRSDRPVSRTDRSVSRTDRAVSRSDHAVSRTDHAFSRFDHAVSRFDHAVSPFDPMIAPLDLEVARIEGEHATAYGAIRQEDWPDVPPYPGMRPFGLTEKMSGQHVPQWPLVRLRCSAFWLGGNLYY